MTTVTFQGNPLKTAGAVPAVGSHAPDFKLTKLDLSDVSLSNFKNKKLILNIFPSVDTPTCAKAEREFNAKANQLNNTEVLCISADLPFAQKRFCAAEGLEHVTPLSTFRNAEFGKTYGVVVAEGPLAGLLSRAVVVIDEHGKVTHAEHVAELSHEPDYAAALAAVK